MSALRVLIGTVAFGGSLTFAQIPPELERAIEAADTIRLRGTRTVDVRIGMERRRVVELVLKDGPRMRIEFPPDSPFRGQVIVETPEGRRHFFPDRNVVRAQPPRREEGQLTRLRGLANRRAAFQFDVENGESIAGFRTRIVTVSGPAGAVLQKFWVEPRTGAILKREVFDRVGTLTAGFQYTEVAFNPRVDPSDFRIEVPDAKRITPEDELARLVRTGGFRFVTLPRSSGAQLESVSVQRINRVPVLAQIFALPRGQRVMLYQMRGAVDRNRLRRAAGGRSAVVSWNDGATSFVLIGGLPEPALRKLARTVQPR